MIADNSSFIAAKSHRLPVAEDGADRGNLGNSPAQGEIGNSVRWNQVVLSAMLGSGLANSTAALVLSPVKASLTACVRMKQAHRATI